MRVRRWICWLSRLFWRGWRQSESSKFCMPIYKSMGGKTAVGKHSPSNTGSPDCVVVSTSKLSSLTTDSEKFPSWVERQPLAKKSMGGRTAIGWHSPLNIDSLDWFVETISKVKLSKSEVRLFVFHKNVVNEFFTEFPKCRCCFSVHSFFWRLTGSAVVEIHSTNTFQLLRNCTEHNCGSTLCLY